MDENSTGLIVCQIRLTAISAIKNIVFIRMSRPIAMNVKSYPKKKRVKLSDAEYHKLRWEAFYRAGGVCEYCGRYAPFDSDYITNGELHHIKTKGSGGHDDLSNSKWVCLYCHEHIHKGHKWNGKSWK